MQATQTSWLRIGCGLACLFVAAMPAAAQDQVPGNNDKNVRVPDKPKKEARPRADSRKEKMTAQTVLIFPPDTPSPAGTADQVTDAVTEVIRRRLDVTNRYHSVYFLPSNALVRRAITDATLAPKEVERPYNPVKAKHIAQVTGYPFVFLTDINGYSFDADKHQVTMSISLSLIDYSGSKPVVRSSGEQSVSSASEPKNASEVTLALDVARDLAEKLMTELFRTKTTAPSTTNTETMPDKKPAK